MDGIGPITNTRTIDDAIGEAIVQLSKAPQTDRVSQLLAEVKRYQAEVASWEHEPPESDVQFEVIGELMSLLSLAMSVAKEPELQVTDVESLAVQLGPGGPISERSKPRPKRTVTGKGMPRLELELDDSPAPVAAAAVPRDVDEALADVLPIRDAVARAPVGGEEGHALNGGARMVCAYREPWRPLPRTAGIRVRLVAIKPSGESRHVMVRLDPGAELPGHQHETAEVLLVLDGCVEVGHDLLHAGGFLLSQSGEIGLPIRSVGESTLMLYDTDRSFGEG